jgi:membrane fusion protein (multidrug efflux system)
MQKSALIGTAIAIVLLIAGALGFYKYSKNHISTDDAQITGHLHPITSRISGSVMQVRVHDNQVVKAGDILFELDDRVLTHRMNMDIAKLNQDTAQLSVNNAKLERDRTMIGLTKRDHERIIRLSRQSFATQSSLDHARADYQVALANEKADKSMHKVLIAAIKKDKANLSIDQLNLRFSKIKAPVGGRITGKTIEKGQFLSPGQVVGYVVPFHMWIVANYKETDLHGIHPGDPVRITVDALPGKTFNGHVDSIQQSTGAVLSLLPPENATGNFTKVVQRVPVKILLDPNSDPDHLLRLGMSVVPVVLPRPGF